MKNNLIKSKLLLKLSCLGLGVLIGLNDPVRADIVYITTFTGSTLTGSPKVDGYLGVSTSGSGEISTVSDAPARTKAIYGNGTSNGTGTPTVVIHPVLTNASTGIYKIETAHNSGTTAGTSASQDVLVTLSSPGCNFTTSCTNTPVFQRSYGGPNWNLIGYLTNHAAVGTMTTPAITIKQSGGTVDNTPNRLYLDAFKFTEIDPCSGVASNVVVVGPTAAGQTYVNVSLVDAGATNVTVYANGTAIGQLNSPSIVAGINAVPTSSLSQSSVLTATQTKNGCTSAQPPTGVLVGGGPNPTVNVFLSCWQNPTNTGPIGANSAIPSSGVYYELKSHGLVSGSQSAPNGGQNLTPGTCWQTVTFDHTIDSGFREDSGVSAAPFGSWCSLDGLVFTIDASVLPDCGPYDIYVDSIVNGTTVIEDFETYTVGSTGFFSAPNSQASFPNPSAAYLPNAVNASTISTNNAASGSKSCRIQWEWNGTNSARWTRVQANATAGKTFPQLDTSKPITVRYLVLPVGQTNGIAFNGTVSGITNGGLPMYAGTTNSLGVTVTGAGPFSYQWYYSDVQLGDGTDRTLILHGGATGLSGFDDQTYTVIVSDANCSETRVVTVNISDPIPTVTNQPVHAITGLGSTAVLMTGDGTGHSPLGYPLSYQWQKGGANLANQTTTALSFPSGVALTDAGSYDLVIGNSYGSVTSSVVKLDVISIPFGNGTGLRGDYRTLTRSTNAFSGSPTLSRTDATIDFNFGVGSPDPLISTDFFTVRWTGQVQALGDDTYTFYTVSDDGVRLWVNGRLLVNNWTSHGATTNSGTIALTGTNTYDVVMEYFEGSVTAVARLYWSAASGVISYGAVPASQLYPGPGITSLPKVSVGLSGGTNAVFSWGTGSYNLAWAPNIDGPFTNYIYGVTSPYTNIISTDPQRFFMLKQ